MLCKRRNVVCVAFLLLLVSATGYGQEAKDISFSTKSPEAMKVFLAGVDLVDNFRTAEAGPYFEKAIQADPGFAIAYDYWAGTASTGEEGWKRMSKAINLAPSASEPERLIILSDKAIMENKIDMARQNIAKLLELLPDSKRAHYYSATFLDGQRDDAAAEKEYNKTISLAPDFAPVYNNYGYFLSRLGRYQEALKALQKYAELKPLEPNPHDSMGEIYLWMADYPNSIKEYQKSLKLGPNFVSSYAGIGHNYVFQRKFNDSRAQYSQMLAHANNVGDTVTAYYWRALSYIYEKKHDSALAVLNEELKFAQARNDAYLEPDVHNNMAIVYLENGNFDKALTEVVAVKESAMKTAVDSVSRQGYIRNCLAMETNILARQGTTDKADAKLAEYLKSIKDVNNPALMRNYHGIAGMVAFCKKDYQTALVELRQSDPLNQYSKYYLALSYDKSGQGDRAKKLYSEIAKYNHNGLLYSTVRQAAMAKM